MARSPTLAVLTPWYPSRNRPFHGAFVQAFAQAVGDRFAEVSLYHADEWAVSLPRPAGVLVRRLYLDLLGGAARDAIAPVAVPEGRLTRYPVPLISRRPWAEHARAHEVVLRRVLDNRPLAADVVHGHVGLPGGWLALRLAAPGVPVFVTEHATFLDRVLAQPAAREMYDEVIAGSTAFFCVGSRLRDQLLAEFPHHAAKLVIVPNAVPFERWPPRDTPVRDLRRWVYVGSFSDRKGVRWLLEAFAVCALDRPDLELTMLGGGPLQRVLEQRVKDLGLSGRVTVLGAVAPPEVFEHLRTADLLVHASRYETFGMTMVEAIAAGVPVLATRCGGPEETLAEVAPIAAELVPVADGVTELVAGYRRLRDRLDRLDLPRARALLEDRYGYAAVSRQLTARYFPDGADPDRADRVGP